MVEAYYPGGIDMPLTDVSINTSELADINDAIQAGARDTTWPLTFSTPDGTSTTVHVTLYDNGPALPPVPGQEQVVGNNFAWGVTTGPLDATHIYHLGNAQATSALGLPMAQNTIDIDSADLLALNDAITAEEQGTTYPLTLTTDGSTGTPATTTIYVTLYHEGPGGYTAGDPHIVANNFSWHITAGNLTEADAELRSLVLASASDSTQGDLAHVVADTTHMSAINAAVQAADISAPPFPLTFTYTCPISAQDVQATVLVTLLGESDLQIDKQVDNINPLPGDIITYTLVATNNGNAQVGGLWIKDYVPDNTTFVSCDTTGIYGATLTGKEFVNWYIAALAPGATQTLTLTVKVSECQSGTGIRNTAYWEDGLSGIPADSTLDPQGGASNSAESIVAAAKTLDTGGIPQMGDMMSLVNLGVLVMLALTLVLVSRRRMNKD